MEDSKSPPQKSEEEREPRKKPKKQGLALEDPDEITGTPTDGS
jgi:hypothetical protein